MSAQGTGRLHEAFGRPSGLVGWLGGIVMAVEHRRLNRGVAGRLDVKPGDRVLEIGCGPGVAARAVAAAVAPGGSVTAIDRSATMIRLVTTLTRFVGGSGVDWRVAPAERLPLPDGSVDVAFAVNAWHHLDDRVRAVTELARVLVDDGRLVVVERTDQSRHPGAPGLSPEAVAALAGELGEGIGTVSVEHVSADRHVLALLTAIRTPVHTKGHTP